MLENQQKSYWKMDVALRLAEQAFEAIEVPVGALILSPNREIIAQAFNQVEKTNNPTAHAEMLAMDQACTRLNSKRLTECTLVVTLEPCAMCAAAIVHYRLKRIVFGAYDPKGGGVEHGACVFSHQQTLHKPEIIGGIREGASQVLLKKFFQQIRFKVG